jgi:phosphatidylserine decarboxylase
MIASVGYTWILGTVLISAVLLLYYLEVRVSVLLVISVILLICGCFFLVFFRDPERRIGGGIVSPADGRILAIYDQTGLLRIGIFMGVTNVHVNRAPLKGRVISVIHKPGGFMPAYLQESARNERVITTMNTMIGRIKIIQIAGILAKRIVPYIKSGQELKKGERIGIIQFGSRVDLIMPSNRIRTLVKKGQSVKAGSTTIAELKR